MFYAIQLQERCYYAHDRASHFGGDLMEKNELIIWKDIPFSSLSLRDEEKLTYRQIMTAVKCYPILVLECLKQREEDTK